MCVTLFVGVKFGRYSFVFFVTVRVFMSCCVVYMCEDGLTRLHSWYKYVDSGLLDMSNAISTHFS